MGLPAEKRRYSITEYLQRERDSLDKHEYQDGEILLTAGGTPDHSLIVANVIRQLGNRLEKTPCRVYDRNLRVGIPRVLFYTYPDATVICGPRQIDVQDDKGETVTNPRLIVEVLSPSTEAYDRGEKFDRYRRLESLEEYVLVSQAVPRIESYWRQPEGTWLFAAVSGLSASAVLHCLSIELPLAQVYAGVEFPAT